MDSSSKVIVEQGVLTLPDSIWDEAKKRSLVIAPLAAAEVVGHQDADEAAHQLGLSRRHVYTLIRRYRQSTGLLTDLAVGKSNGGKGKERLSQSVERVIRELIQKSFLTRQKRTQAAFYRNIVQACKAKNLPVPARNTVALRIARLNPIERVRSREGVDAVRPLQSAGGVAPKILAPLDQVQIDHTIIDLIIVDEQNRQPIGRPYLTLAIDVYSRCLVGMVVTLEAPSATSVGLCLAHIACDKRPWLERLGVVDVNWPMSGKPKMLYMDNASEFKSEALRRGCEQHGIQLDYRPLGQPHYGGIVERIIGTMMQRIHELSGTTFSNTHQRGSYDAEKMATLTLHELECWLTLAVASYHGSFHETLQQTPAARWDEGIKNGESPIIVTHATAFLVDFLPVIRRTLTRTGFVIDHIHYFTNALKPWIARRADLSSFIIRRDPRDISRVWVLDPDNQQYLEVPYRTLSHPAITLWEQRQSLAQLRQSGRDQVDEAALFRMIQQMRDITHSAKATTKKVRRNIERLQHLKNETSLGKTILPPESALDTQTDNSGALPFNQIEEW